MLNVMNVYTYVCVVFWQVSNICFVILKTFPEQHTRPHSQIVLQNELYETHTVPLLSLLFITFPLLFAMTFSCR